MTGRRTIPLDQILLGDCLGLLQSLPDECVDLVVSSPPYNLGKEYESRRALDVYLAEQKIILGECARVLRRTGSIFWQVGAYADSGRLIPLDIRVFPILEDFGLIPRNRIVWLRQHGVHARKKFSCRHETLLWFTKSEEYPFNLDAIRVPQKYPEKKAWRGDKKGQLTGHPQGKNPGDIWVFRNVRHNHEEETIHPCQFPEDMIARIVLTTTNPGNVVLDPYMGSGTVAVVARDLGRHFLGSEIDKEYHEVALWRLSGKPDERGIFSNLKTLRDFAERTGTPTGRYRFQTQVGSVPTDRSKARIFPEEHHLKELEKRVGFEEEAWAARRNGAPIPAPPPRAERNAKRSPPSDGQVRLPT